MCSGRPCYVCWVFTSWQQKGRTTLAKVLSVLQHEVYDIWPWPTATVGASASLPDCAAQNKCMHIQCVIGFSTTVSYTTQLYKSRLRCLVSCKLHQKFTVKFSACLNAVFKVAPAQRASRLCQCLRLMLPRNPWLVNAVGGVVGRFA